MRTHLLARGVLALPRTPEDYLPGRSRRAVRTNISHAAKQGVRCTSLKNGPPAEAAVRRLAAHGLVDNADVLLARSADEWMIALDRDDQVVGGALVTVDRTLGDAQYPRRGQPIRSATHFIPTVVLALGAAGVEYLFASNESALVLSDGLQYLQRILGYRVVNLRLGR